MSLVLGPISGASQIEFRFYYVECTEAVEVRGSYCFFLEETDDLFPAAEGIRVDDGYVHDGD